MDSQDGQQSGDHKPLRLILALTLGAAAVAVCYFCVDQPVARFLNSHRFYPEAFLVWAPLLSEWVSYLLMLGIAVIVVWRLWRPGGRTQTLLLAIALNLPATVGIKSLLKWVFGRTWPETWAENRHALIANSDYGFHFFHVGKDYQSFPSGHAAATFAVISILWISRPRWRWLFAAVGGLMCMALVGMNFHFVSDVIAGAMLGSVTGIYATRVFCTR